MNSVASGAVRPVWLFSLDSEHFHAAPTATGGLIAWYRVHGANPAGVDFRQLHFRERDEVARWIDAELASLGREADAALKRGVEPVVGLSFYTWNAAEFLELARAIRRACPAMLIVAGGPHVQQAESYLGTDPIDVIVLGEGELTFQELLDTPRERWFAVPGLAWLGRDGSVRSSGKRERLLKLGEIPSPFDVIALSDDRGRPLYDAVTYETSRGCPYSCAFCEWGTGAIGTKMVSVPLDRLRADWEKIARAGIPNLWLADSNFGALKDDLEKARLICDLKARYGLPRSFATSWSKKHSPRVQEIVLLLNAHGLLPFYQLALQTLTPLALELAHRENMAANDYEPIARKMAAAGVPVSAELIWGLPGDNLSSFERNLDRLLATFPNINIFGYTLLPGTEFYARREEYAIATVPVAGYGKAKGEYVVGCHSFDRREGEEGYFLITAHLLLISGHVLPLTTRFIALAGGAPAGTMLRAVLDALLAEFAVELGGVDASDRMAVYEARAEIYLRVLAEPERCFRVIDDTVLGWLAAHGAASLIPRASRTLLLDRLFCPRYGARECFRHALDFDARAVLESLRAMSPPAESAFDERPPETLWFESPGGLGEVLKGPDGGRWLESRLLDSADRVQSGEGSIAIAVLPEATAEPLASPDLHTSAEVRVSASINPD